MNSPAAMNPETMTQYSHAELKAAFDAVCDEHDWKMPIDAAIHPDMVGVTHEAVIFFAGCAPKFTVVGRRVNVKAVGYYNAVCA